MKTPAATRQNQDDSDAEWADSLLNSGSPVPTSTEFGR